MKLVYSINHATSVEVECPKLQDVIKSLTEIRDSVGFEPCGKCKSDYTFPRHRNADSNDFYEYVCGDCGAVLQLGTSKDAQLLYKKRMKTDNKGKAIKIDDKAVYLPNNGWQKWNNETKQME